MTGSGQQPRSDGGSGDADRQAEEFTRLRPLLFSIAYDMIGSVADAEDIVSEAFVQLHKARGAGVEVQSLKAYLTTVVSRLSLNYLRSARVRRERYYGTWLPEPVISDEMSPTDLSDSLSLALLVLLESLSPVERAVFLLHDVFALDYRQIASIVDRGETNCRQIASRARRHVDQHKPRFDAEPRQRKLIADRFFGAVEDGDLEALVEMLAADVVMYGDGGGRGPSLPRPVHGRAKVLGLIESFVMMLGQHGMHLERTTINGQPGVLVRDRSGALLNVLSIDILDGQVQTVHSIINPDKLDHLGPLLGPEHPLRRGAGRRRPE